METIVSLYLVGSALSDEAAGRKFPPSRLRVGLVIFPPLTADSPARYTSATTPLSTNNNRALTCFGSSRYIRATAPRYAAS